MRQLLDTQIVLWFLNGEKLSPELCERIVSGTNDEMIHQYDVEWVWV